MGDLKTPKFPSDINWPAIKNGCNLEDDWHGVKTLWFQLKGEKIKVERLRFGFYILIFLSILSDFLSWKKLTQKWQEPKAEQCAKFKLLNNEIDQKTNFAKFQMAIFGVSLQVIYNYSALGCSYFCVSFYRERKLERFERKIKTHNPILSLIGNNINGGSVYCGYLPDMGGKLVAMYVDITCLHESWIFYLYYFF